jgi:hypothetical protein
MRAPIYFAAAGLVAASAFWAYRVNYMAQEAQVRVAALRAEIGREREAIAVLRAEWAWLSAPDRIRRLAEANAEALALVPLGGAAFLDLAAIPRVPPEVPADPEGEVPGPLAEGPRIGEGRAP